MADNTISKLYDIRALGSDIVLKDLNKINNLFKELKLNKQALMNLQGTVEDPVQLAAIARQLKELAVKEAELKVKRQELINQSKAQQLIRQQEIAAQKALEAQLKNENAQRSAAEKTTLAQAQAERQLALARAADAKAAADQARADLARLQAQIAQEKELDRLIALEEKARAAAAKEQAANQTLAGSYNALKAEIKELYTVVKSAPKGSSIALPDGTLLSYDQAIEKLKLLMAEEQNFRRQFQRDGTLVGEYTTGILQAFQRFGLGDLIEAQAEKAQGALAALNEDFEQLKTALREAQASGSASLTDIEARLIENRNAAATVEEQMQNINEALRSNGTIGQQVTSQIREGFAGLRGQIGQLLVSYLGFQAAFAGLRSGVEIARDLSDETTNLEVELDKAAGGAQNLVDQLAKLDTRTKLAVLEKMANIAAKAGAGEQELAGVVEAIDKIKIAFGKDFGDVEAGTESLVKIINIFEGAGNVTGENLLKTGNAIRTLANESVASVPYLNDFTQRMAGLKGTFDISLPSVLGLASGFENFGQSAEVASTALVKIIPKLASEADKFAAIAGVTREQFSQLLNNDPTEAFLRVSQALVQTKGGVEDFSAAFADSELGSGRVASIIGVAGKNADEFRNKVALAGASFNDTGNIEVAFAAKNENLAATLDKVSKAFSDAANNRAFVGVINLAASAVLGFINLLAAIPFGVYALGIGAVTVATASYVRQQALALIATIRATAAKVTENTVLGINTTALIVNGEAVEAVTIAQRIQLAAARGLALIQGILAGEITITTIAMGALNAVMAINPFVLAGFAIAALVLAFKALYDRSEALRNSLAPTLADISEGFNALKEAFVSVASALAPIVTVIRQAFSSVGDALGKIGITAPVVIKVIITPIILLGQTIAFVFKGIAGVINGAVSLFKNFYEATASILGGAGKIIQGIFTLDFDKIKAGLQQGLDGVTQITARAGKDAAAAFREGFRGEMQSPSALQIFNFLSATYGKEFAANFARSAIERMKQLNLPASLQAIIQKQLGDVQTKSGVNLGINVPVVPPSVKELDDKIAAIDEQIKTRNERSAIAALQAQRKVLEDQRKALLGEVDKTKAATGSRLSGAAQDLFKDIEARQKALLTALETKYAAGEIQERNYVLALQKINDDAANQKIARLNGTNAAERQKRAELQLEITQRARKTNEDLLKIDLEALQAKKDAAERDARQELDQVNNDPNSTLVQKAEAELAFDQKRLEQQKQFQADADALEKQYNLISLKNTENRADATLDAEEKVSKDRVALNKALHEQLSNETNKLEDDANLGENLGYADKRRAAFAAAYASEEARNRALQELEQEHQDELTGIRLAALLVRQQNNEYEKRAGTITATEYQNDKKQIDLAIAETTASIAEQSAKRQERVYARARDMIGKFANALQEANDKIIGPLFDAQRQQLEQLMAARTEQLDNEKKARLAGAQSKAEEEAIEQEYASKRKAAEKKAAEEKKQLALKELAISSAIAAVRSLLSLPNYIQVGINLALVAASYALQRRKIMQQTFARGGVPVAFGGDIVGPSHNNGGVPFEAEGGELAIINKRSAASNRILSVMGTPRQIASAINEHGGGVSFAGGAMVRKYADGGYIGSNVRPPVFQSYLSPPARQNGARAEDISKLMEMVAATQETILAEASKKVMLNPNAVTKEQNAQARSIDLSNI